MPLLVRAAALRYTRGSLRSLVRNPLLPVYIVTIGEVGAVVPAAALFAAQRGARNQASDREDTRRPPVVGVEDAPLAERRVQFLPGRFKERQRARQPITIAKEPNVLPHRP